jgi:hypothetical protein
MALDTPPKRGRDFPAQAVREGEPLEPPSGREAMPGGLTGLPRGEEVSGLRTVRAAARSDGRWRASGGGQAQRRSRRSVARDRQGLRRVSTTK